MLLLSVVMASLAVKFTPLFVDELIIT
ncbi:hypothetical protein [Apibacter sp. HY039]